MNTTGNVWLCRCTACHTVGLVLPGEKGPRPVMDAQGLGLHYHDWQIVATAAPLLGGPLSLDSAPEGLVP